MLYDPKWKLPGTKEQPSLLGFIAFLARQNPDERYLYMPVGRCPIRRHLHTIGIDYGAAAGGPLGRTLAQWNEKITRPEPRTFGAALARARTLTEHVRMTPNK